MKCLSCGQPIPPSSRFCLTCGAPIQATVPPTGASTPSASIPPGSPIGAGPAVAAGVRASGPAKALMIAFAALALTLAIGTAAIIKNRQGLPSGESGLQTPAGLATAPSQPPTAGGLAIAPSQPPTAGGLATAPSIPAHPVGLPMNPTTPPPAQAQPPEDVRPYLEALQKIEEERQQINIQMANQLSADMSKLTGGGKNSDPMTILLQSMSGMAGSMTEDNGLEQYLAVLQKAVQSTRVVAQKYAGLVQEVQGLETTPGVPKSCKNLQTDYLSLLAAYEAISTAKNGDLMAEVSLLQSVNTLETQRVNDAEGDLEGVFSGAKIDPFFKIQDPDNAAAGGSSATSNPLGAPNTHGH